MDEAARQMIRTLKSRYDVDCIPRPTLPKRVGDFADKLGIRWWCEMVVMKERAPVLVITGGMGTGKTVLLKVLATLPVHVLWQHGTRIDKADLLLWDEETPTNVRTAVPSFWEANIAIVWRNAWPRLRSRPCVLVSVQAIPAEMIISSAKEIA